MSKIMTLEELMREVERTSFPLADGNNYAMKNWGEFTFAERRKLKEDMDEYNSALQFSDTNGLAGQRILRSIFYDDLPEDVIESTTPNQVAALLDFCQFGKTQREIDEIIGRATDEATE